MPASTRSTDPSNSDYISTFIESQNLTLRMSNMREGEDIRMKLMQGRHKRRKKRKGSNEP